MARKYEQTETPDPTPMAVPLGFKRPEPLSVMVARMVRSERFKEAIEQQGFETIDEAEDFDIPGEDLSSPHELAFDPELGREIPRQVKHQLDTERARIDAEINKAKQQSAAKRLKRSMARFEEEEPAPARSRPKARPGPNQRPPARSDEDSE